MILDARTRHRMLHETSEVHPNRSGVCRRVDERPVTIRPKQIGREQFCSHTWPDFLPICTSSSVIHTHNNNNSFSKVFNNVPCSILKDLRSYMGGLRSKNMSHACDKRLRGSVMFGTGCGI
ncbi:unnamed protein product, partial [Ectocarpus sp. 8 AP-2014]